MSRQSMLSSGRFIPARAGNTPGTRGAFVVRTVHPRSRGEHIRPPMKRVRVIGSSPLARGTRQRSDPGVWRSRFIPARAGNTRAPPGSLGCRAVHPRSRGEHGGNNSRSRVMCGSSPLARGTRPVRSRIRSLLRFIPARAGNTIPSVLRSVTTAVHPRSRGEHGISRPQTLH